MNKFIYKGHYIQKNLGQIFLTDINIINNIIELLNIKNHHFFVEIGPGLGALTLPISKYTKNIIVIEIDPNLVKKLANNPELKNKIKIIKKDVLTINFDKIFQITNQKLRLFGNLPYNISIPLIFNLFSYINNITDMNFMLQKEVVNRLIATPNNKIYGKLSIMAQYFYKIIPMLTVPATAFKPIPKVDSMVVRLIPHKITPYPICNINLLNKILTIAFSKRRKIISNSLKNLFSIQDLINMNIDINNRAENITIKQYCKLSNFLHKIKAKS